MRRLPVPLLPRSLRWGSVLAVCAVVVYFSLVTVPPKPAITQTPFWDKYLHFAAYFAVALVLAYATANHRGRPYRRATIVLGGAIAFGAAIELLQGAVPYRYFGWEDLLANCLGAGLVALWFPIERQIHYVHARRLAESVTRR